jgi:diguanylate cyclase (GGDEF)-like protein/PAS domain S-box-containing protein
MRRISRWNAGGFITDWNPQAEATFGWSREEAVGRVLSDTIIPPRYREAHLRGLERFLETGEGPVLEQRFEIEALHRDGYEFPIELAISAHLTADTHVFHAFLHDISERRRKDQFLAAERETATVLAEAETVAETVPRLLCAIGEQMSWEFGAYWTMGEGSVLRCRATWTMSGFDFSAFDRATRERTLESGAGLPGRVWASERPVFIEEVVADPAFTRAAEAAEAGLSAAVCVPLMAKGSVHGVIEFFTRDARHVEPETVEMMETLAAQIARFLTILAERSELVSRLEQLSLTDELTGLPNRRGWNEAFARELARASRDGESLCVVLLDLDRFKAFNDEHGHPAGDALLREAAREWGGLLRASDLLARYGGEEFAVAFHVWPLDAAHAVVERLRAATPGGVTCSAGLVASSKDESAEEVIARADSALYAAKRGGRDRTAGERQVPDR